MGISRDSRHKRRLTGGRFPVHKKKRKYELGRPSSNTKLGSRLVRKVRCRGGNLKFRALRLDSGNFSWGTQNTQLELPTEATKIAKNNKYVDVTRKTRIMDVVYNASSNELVRTKTLVKNAIVTIDPTPYKLWFKTHYGLELGKSSEDPQAAEKVAKLVPKALLDQFSSGRLLACVSSRPGQCGRCDGYVLEGEELAFYRRRMDKKKRV